VNQVFGHFLHRHNVLKENIRTAANHTIEIVEDFWSRAKIPVKHRQDSIKKLEQIFGEWMGLKKNKNRKTQIQHANEVTFSEMMEQLFDIAHANAMELIENKEDKLFLELQRKKGRPGCMMGVDQMLLQQQQKKKEKDQKIQKRRQRFEMEKDALSAKVVLDSSSSGNNSEEVLLNMTTNSQFPVQMQLLVHHEKGVACILFYPLWQLCLIAIS